MFTILAACGLTCSALASDRPSAPTASPTAAGSVLYLKVQLTRSVKLTSLKPGDVVDGTLSDDVYSGERQLFAAGSAIHLRVDGLERRRRTLNDHWPWVIKVFAPRHENYPLFRSAVLSLPDGEVQLRVSVVAINNPVDVCPPNQQRESSKSGMQAELAVSPSCQVRKGNGPTLTLEANAPADVFSPGTSLAPENAAPLTLAAGTQARIILLSSVSASRSHAGDTFQARLIEPVRLDSKVALPEGSIFEGKVLQSTPPRWLSRPGSMYLTFTSLTLPGGRSTPVEASISQAVLDQRSHTRLDVEGQLSGGHVGKAWMFANLGVTAGIAKETDDAMQLAIEAIVSTATDASTAGIARIVSTAASGVFLISRHGRDVALPRFTEMRITFNRPVSLRRPETGSPH